MQTDVEGLWQTNIFSLVVSVEKLQVAGTLRNQGKRQRREPNNLCSAHILFWFPISFQPVPSPKMPLSKSAGTLRSLNWVVCYLILVGLALKDVWLYVPSHLLQDKPPAALFLQVLHLHFRVDLLPMLCRVWEPGIHSSTYTDLAAILRFLLFC